MGIATRFYLFPEDGSLRRVPQRVAYELPHGSDAIPELAGTRQRVLEVLAESEGGKPARILDARGFYWSFDDNGKIDESLAWSLGERMEAHDSVRRARRMKVPDLRPEIRMRELKAKHEWTPTAEDLDRVAADIWPGLHGPAPDIASVKGTKPRKPALTHEGRWALERIETHIAAIVHELEGLSERALKGMSFEAMRLASHEHEGLWRGLADEAKRHEAIRAAHRTGRGEWYAVVEVARASRDYAHLWEQVTVAHERCSSRKDAVEAGRKLMVEKASWMDADIDLSASVRSAFEWRPDE